MLASDDDILLEADRWTKAGRSVAVAIVIETWGSAPRPIGAHLVVDADGNFLGSVSGGCVEAEVVTQGRESISTGNLRVLEFGVSDETAWRAGLSCGGRIKILVRPLDPDILAAISIERASRRPCALVTDLASGAERLVRQADLVADPFAAAIEELLRRHESRVIEDGGGRYFITAFAPAGRSGLPWPRCGDGARAADPRTAHRRRGPRRRSRRRLLLHRRIRIAQNPRDAA